MAASAALADELSPSTGCPRTRSWWWPRARRRAAARATARPAPGTAVAFLSVGNWVPRKGALELLEAFAGARPRPGHAAPRRPRRHRTAATRGGCAPAWSARPRRAGGRARARAPATRSAGSTGGRRVRAAQLQRALRHGLRRGDGRRAARRRLAGRQPAQPRRRRPGGRLVPSPATSPGWRPRCAAWRRPTSRGDPAPGGRRSDGAGGCRRGTTPPTAFFGALRRLAEAVEPAQHRTVRPDVDARDARVLDVHAPGDVVGHTERPGHAPP